MRAINLWVVATLWVMSSSLQASECQRAVVAERYGDALSVCIQEAESGRSESAFQLAVLYAQGTGVPVDLTESVRWLRSAAEAGHVDAAYNLAVASYLGRGTSVDLEEAVRWYKRSAEKFHPKAMRDLATLYVEGRGVPQDLAKAYTLYHDAAVLGSAESQLKAGLMLLRGEGVQADRTEALNWLRRAAEQNVEVAQYTLGLLLVEGLPEQSTQWYRRAALLGYPDAMHNLAYAYLHGVGTPRDFEMARHWAEQANKQGGEQSAALLNEIDRQEATTDPALLPTSAVKGLAWLAQQRGSDYVIQLSRHSELEGAERFMRMFALSFKDVVIYRDPGKEKPSFLVLYGRYDDSGLARRAIATLSLKLQAQKPWVRNLAGLKVARSTVPESSSAVIAVDDVGYPVDPGEKNARWLTKRPPERVVIQLLATPVEHFDDMRSFIQTHGLAESTLFYTSHRESGDYLVLLYAREFERVADAQRVIGMLPYAVRQARPWIRQYSHLQASFLASSDRE